MIGVDLGDGTVELGFDRSTIQEARRGREVLIDQQLVLRSTDFPAGRSVRQRLELCAGGTVVLEQTVDGLPTSTPSREGGSQRSDAPPVEQTRPRKRRNPHSSDMMIPDRTSNAMSSIFGYGFST